MTRTWNKQSVRRSLGITAVALALAACGTTSNTDSTSVASATGPVPLGASVQVQGVASAFSSDDDGYEGSVTVDSNPGVYTKADGSQVLVFHVQVSTTKGKVPTSSWSLETENAMPVSPKGTQDEGIATPPLGPEVSSNAKGYITFEVPRRTKPTTLDLFGNYDTSKEPLAQWSLDELPSAQPYPSAAATATPSPAP